MMPGRHRRGVWVWQRVPAADFVAYAVARQVGDLFLSIPLRLDAHHRRWLLDVAKAVECDIPWWLNCYRTTDGEPLDQAVLGRVALATAMTFRRTVTGENGLLAIARPVLAAARAMGTSVRLAVDTTRPAPGEEHTSFYGHPARDLARALDEVDAALVFDEAYAGIAVHDLAGWRGLPGSASG